MLEVEGTGAEHNDGGTISLGNIDSNVGEDEISEVNEGGFQGVLVAGFVGFEDSRAELDHAKMVKTEEGSGEKHERDKDEDELPNPHGFEGAENSSQSIRFFATHCYI